MDAYKFMIVYKSMILLVFVCLTLFITYHFGTGSNNNNRAIPVTLQPFGSIKDKNVRDQNDSARDFQKTRELKKGGHCKTCIKSVPDVIVQYGAPRTATTLQFQILCVMMTMVHENEANSVGCDYYKKPAHKYSVIKTHDIYFLLESLPSSAWIFMTSSSTLSPQRQDQIDVSVQKIKNKSISIPYMADIETVLKRGYFIAYEYQSIFSVTDEQMRKIAEYFHYWDILRICCGKEMSSDWRNHLSPEKYYKRRHDTYNATYIKCDKYNISDIESLFMKTYIYKRFAGIKSLHNALGKPSIFDGELDGTYCERCNANITKHHLQIGKKCV